MDVFIGGRAALAAKQAAEKFAAGGTVDFVPDLDGGYTTGTVMGLAASVPSRQRQRRGAVGDRDGQGAKPRTSILATPNVMPSSSTSSAQASGLNASEQVLALVARDGFRVPEVPQSLFETLSQQTLTSDREPLELGEFATSGSLPIEPEFYLPVPVMNLYELHPWHASASHPDCLDV